MAEGESLEKVVGGWKKYTARRINVNKQPKSEMAMPSNPSD